MHSSSHVHGFVCGHSTTPLFFYSVENLGRSCLWQPVHEMTLTLPRNRQGTCSNWRFSPATAATRAALESRESLVFNVCARERKTRPNRCWGPPHCFVKDRKKQNARTLVEGWLAHPIWGFSLVLDCHLNCFADGFTEEHVKQPLSVFTAVCLVEAAWHVGPGKYNLLKSIRFFWNRVMEGLTLLDSRARSSDDLATEGGAGDKMS